MTLKPATLIVSVAPALEDEWAASFDTLIARFRPAAIVIDRLHRANAALIAQARDASVALLVHTQPDDTIRKGSDGVVLYGGPEQVASARSTLGTSAIIGARCDLSRHDAMEKAEAGADFIVFSANDDEELGRAVELCAWWDEVATVPSALEYVLHHPAANNLAAARPDFVVVRETVKAGESLNFAIEFGLQNSI